MSRTAVWLVRALLEPVEKALLMSVSLEEDAFSKPVFVIGPPRSGTTLLYQALANRFKFVYFTNLSSRLYFAPLIGTGLSKLLGAFSTGTKMGYESRYGRTAALNGPHEAGEFWYRWFPRGEHVYVAPGETQSGVLEELRRQVIGISRTFHAPMLFKNTYNSMRIAPIMEAFPNAVFLVCRRDPLDTAQSILEGRLKRNGNKDEWWSVPPKEIDEIRDHPYWEQVVEQVYYIYGQISDDSRRYGEDRFLNVSYRGLCENPRGTLEEIRMFLRDCGVEVSIRNEAPERFSYSTGKKINDEEYARLRRKVNELWKA